MQQFRSLHSRTGRRENNSTNFKHQWLENQKPYQMFLKKRAGEGSVYCCRFRDITV